LLSAIYSEHGKDGKRTSMPLWLGTRQQALERWEFNGRSAEEPIELLFADVYGQCEQEQRKEPGEYVY